MRQSLLHSLALHGAFLLILIVSPFIPSLTTPLFLEKVTWIELPLGTEFEGTVGFKKVEELPKSTIQEQKNPVLPGAPPKEETMTVKTPPIIEKPVQKAQPPRSKPKKKPEEDLIRKALARIDTDLKKREAVPEAAQVPEGSGAGVPFGTPVGERVSRFDPEYLKYQATTRQRIMDQWIVPITLQQEDLSCQLGVRINEKGEVIKTEWVRRSGSEALDLSAVRAVERSSPLDIPPTRLQYEALTEGFLIEFDTLNAKSP